MKVYLRSNFYDIITDLRDKYFYIFGNTTFANVFYLYCRENRVDHNIKAFIISKNIQGMRRRHTISGIPVKDINWLKEEDKGYSIFLAAKEKTIKEQIISLLDDNSDCCVYYVSDFANCNMFYKYMYLCYQDITKRYITSSNLYDQGYVNISEKGKTNFYKYLPGFSVGVLPDKTLFDGKVGIDKLYEQQLGDYTYIDQIKQKCKSEYICRIFLVRSHFDKILTEDFYTPYVESIQAGADLTALDISELKDNKGDNISKRNQDYCEMSAVYWAWKNDTESDYIGFCHYRRRFVINENTVNYIMINGYDAIYTIPKLIDGGIREEFVERCDYLTSKAWELTQDMIKQWSPEYLEAWVKLEGAHFFIPCNMFIMRRDIFCDYCSWMFLILEKIDEYYLIQGIQCNNRYLGYIAECLTNVYVMKHKNTLKKGFVELKVLGSRE